MKLPQSIPLRTLAAIAFTLSLPQAGGSCTLMVTFTPSAAGSSSASLAVVDNANGSPQTVSLSGTGITPATTISLSSANLAFGQENMAATAPVQTVTLTNTGKASLSISSIAIGGADPSDFSQTNTCGSSVAAGAKCTLSVSFAPTAIGSRIATLALTDNATGSPQTVSLNGTGVAAATPAGTYQVVVNGSSNGDLHNMSVTVNVQ